MYSEEDMTRRAGEMKEIGIKLSAATAELWSRFGNLMPKEMGVWIEDTFGKVYCEGHAEGEEEGITYVLRELHSNAGDIAQHSNFVRDAGVTNEVTAAIERYAEQEADGLDINLFADEDFSNA